MKISKTSHTLASKLSLSLHISEGVLKIHDGSGEPEPGFANTPWALFKLTTEGTLLWYGQLGGTCLKPHQLRQIPLEIRDEKGLRKLLKVLHTFAME